MDNNRQQSEFNMAVSYLNRLNSLLTICDISSMELQVYNWYHSLYTLFREISTELKKEEIEKYKVRFNEMSNDVNQWLNNSQRGINKIEPELYNKLSEMEIDLRTILKESGLQNKMKDDPRFAR
jgi:hypothetical protein